MKKIFFIVAVSILFHSSCKEEYFKDGGLADGRLNMTTYDFIKSRPDLFEKLIWIIDKNDLKDQINKEGNTFFIPKDKSIEDYLQARDQETVQLDKLPQAEIDTLGIVLQMYLFPYKIMRKDLSQKMKEYVSISDELMGISLRIEPYKEIPGFGPSTVILSGPVRIQPDTFVKIRNNADVATSDLESNNGAIHVLRHTTHIFGFF